MTSFTNLPPILQRAYLIKLGKVIVERPQHMLMRVAIGIHCGDLEVSPFLRTPARNSPDGFARRLSWNRTISCPVNGSRTRRRRSSTRAPRHPRYRCFPPPLPQLLPGTQLACFRSADVLLLPADDEGRQYSRHLRHPQGKERNFRPTSTQLNSLSPLWNSPTCPIRSNVRSFRRPRAALAWYSQKFEIFSARTRLTFAAHVPIC